MKDDALILASWAAAVRDNSPAILATVVKVSGSAYRNPGARMLITDTGRIGSISGGCLEADLLKKAWWLTGERPATVRVYDNTSDDDAIWAFGLGCNGIVHVLLERWDARTQPLTIDLLEACRTDRRGGALATVISGDLTGEGTAIFPDGSVRGRVGIAGVEAGARAAFVKRKSHLSTYDDAEVFIEYVDPPVPLLVVGAGQDAAPVVRFARELGWHITVVDGRSNQARAERFPEADAVHVIDLQDPLRNLTIDDRTVAVLMSHSYEQDRTLLQALHPFPLRYLGVLGPRQRTDRMICELGLTAQESLHSPVGLDLGADAPEQIALSIVSEIQAVLNARGAGMLSRRAGPIHLRA